MQPKAAYQNSNCHSAAQKMMAAGRVDFFVTTPDAGDIALAKGEWARIINHHAL